MQSPQLLAVRLALVRANLLLGGNSDPTPESRLGSKPNFKDTLFLHGRPRSKGLARGQQFHFRVRSTLLRRYDPMKTWVLLL